MEAVLLPAESLLVSIPHLSIDLLNTEIKARDAKGTQVEIFHVSIVIAQLCESCPAQRSHIIDDPVV